jgi:hypothetical protein
MIPSTSRPSLARSFWALGVLLGASSLPAQDIIRIEAVDEQLQIWRQVPISTEVTGTLVLVEPNQEGVEVRKGDVLIRVNDAVIQKEVLHARTQAEQETEIEFARKSVASAEKELQRKQEGNRESPGLYTPVEMETAQLDVDKANAQLAKAQDDQILYGLNAEVKEATLAQYQVVAPFDGVVTKVHRFPAQNVRPGDPVLTVTDMSQLRALVKVPLRYRDLLFPGDEVEIRPRLDATPVATEPLGSPRTTSQQRATERPIGDAEGFFNNSGPSAEPFEPAFVSGGATSLAMPVTQDVVFTGTIEAIEPEVVALTGNQGYAVSLNVSVPNRKDRFGRWALQQGLPIDAIVLARKRAE